MFAKFARPLVQTGISPSVIAYRQLSGSNKLFQGAATKSVQVDKSTSTGESLLID
jgi:hypothetical protein